MSDTTPRSPRDDIFRAWAVLLNPREFDEIAINSLLQRGYDTWENETGDRDQEQILEDVQDFVLWAVEQPTLNEVEAHGMLAEPDQPGRLMVLGTLGSMVILHNPSLQYYPRKITYHEHVENLFAHHLQLCIERYDGGSYPLQRMAAEIVYQRDHEDKYSPPPNNTVTAITEMPQFGPGLYVEIPMTHTSTKCVVRDDNGELQTYVTNNCAYVPASDFHGKFQDHLVGRNGITTYLGKKVNQLIDDKQTRFIVANCERVSNHIEKLLEAYRTQDLFAEQTHPEKLEVILKAVDAVSNDVVAINEWQTAKDIYSALEVYARKTNSDREQKVIRDIGNARSLGNYLQRTEDHEDVEILHHHEARKQGITELGQNQNLYRLRFNQSEATTIQVSKIGDILELPCMRNIHEFLMEEKPVRFVLYTYARMILSLENDFTIEDIVEWYSQYPWFDEETTRYQVRYETRRDDDEDDPFIPINCFTDNEQFKDFCIGLDNCEYVIHESLPIKKEVLDAKEKQ